MAYTGAYGVSTNGVTYYYGISNSKDTLPTEVTQLNRINSSGGVTVSPENIDASAMEDSETHNIAGRSSLDESKTFTVNLTDETLKEWQDLIAAFKGKTSSQFMWFETVIPGLSKATWICGEPPALVPDPEMGQNELLTVEINVTVVKWHGFDTKVLPTT